jgi:murein DD-endopeptidase MepM/ murein hydrolase activator NlpD
MDSIIARQKIGKRRTLSKPSHRLAAGGRDYPSLLLDSAGDTPIRNGIAQGKRKPRFGLLDSLPRRKKPGPSLPRATAHPGRGPGALLGALAPALLRAASRLLRSLRARASKASKLGLATGASALLAALLALAFGISALLRGPSFPLPSGALLPESEAAQEALLEYLSPELADGKADSGQDAAALPPVPVTLEMSTYTIRPNDSLASIAKRFGLNLDTLISVNGIASTRSMRSGAQLRVPNINGLVYKVRSGEGLASVAKRYKVDATRIVDANDLGSARLTVGQSLFIPGARLPQSAIAQAMGQLVAWPARGPISSYFGYRPDPFTGVRRFHTGIDIVMNSGTPVRAAMAGRISDVGYNANYGNYIIMTHADGYQTLYGHLSSILAREGSAVDQGAQIGLSGNTGYSTGAHLHFSLFRRSLLLNPLKYLK